MNRTLLALAAAGLLALGGCATPPEPPPPPPQPAPPPVQRPTPPEPSRSPAGAPRVDLWQGATVIHGVQESYLWFAGARRLAVANEAGLWSVRPDGGLIELLAPAGPARTLVGPYADGLLYLEQQQGALVAYLVRPGEPPWQVGAVEHPSLEQPGYPFWASLSKDRLAVAVEGRRVVAIDLVNGQSRELGDEAVPVYGAELALSPDRRYLAYKEQQGGEARVLDLESGAVFRPSQESHAGKVAWSPTGQWAVRATAEGADLPTHLDLGDTRGGLRHLTPPYPLELVEGPWWSVDGRYLAVLSGSADEPGIPRHLWSIDPESGEWLRLGILPPGGQVEGFAPFEPSLIVHGSNGLWLWPADGSEMLRVEHPWKPGSLLISGMNRLYLTAEAAPRLLLQRPGSEPAALLTPGGAISRLTLQGNLATLVRQQSDGTHDLIILSVNSAE